MSALKLRQGVSVAAVWHALHPHRWHSKGMPVLCLGGGLHQAQRPANSYKGST